MLHIQMNYYHSPMNGPFFHSNLHLSNGRYEYEIHHYDEYESRLIITNPTTLESIAYEMQSIATPNDRHQIRYCLSSPNTIVLQNNILTIE